jgi:hypothetical protein
MAAKKGPENNLKNKSKEDGGWCTDDLYFDEEGCLYVANKALADAIQSSMDAWKNRLKMYRDDPKEPSTPGGKAESYPGGVIEAAGRDRRADSKAAGVPGALKPTGGTSADATEGGTDVKTLNIPLDVTGSGTADSGNPANMMCPCAPEK